MPSPSPRGFTMTRHAHRLSVSRAQLLLQYLLALEFGAAEREPSSACEDDGFARGAEADECPAIQPQHAWTAS
jgi:hypothetical protein